MTTNHATGPASLSTRSDSDYPTLIKANGEVIADTMRLVLTSGPDVKAGRARAEANRDNARRLVAAWNVCQGISTGVLELNATAGGVETLERQRNEAWAGLHDLVQFFDVWEQILPQDAREALRPIAEAARPIAKAPRRTRPESAPSRQPRPAPPPREPQYCYERGDSCKMARCTPPGTGFICTVCGADCPF